MDDLNEGQKSKKVSLMLISDSKSALFDVLFDFLFSFGVGWKWSGFCVMIPFFFRIGGGLDEKKLYLGKRGGWGDEDLVI